MAELIDDRYELVEVIASGGMASVWRARDVRLDRPVALKRPHPAVVSDPATARRMDREARAAAALNHPNVITVFDYGEDEDGPFLAMELVEGPTLAEAAHAQGPGAAFEIGATLAGALAAIHAAGIVHRDIKPANVIMSDRGWLLTDFGIALDPQRAALTDPGKIVATPSYAAPEVLAGEPPTAAADVYSLAVVIAELAAGAPMFDGFDRPQAAPDIGDPTLAAVLEPALSPSPDQRPSAGELETSLRSAAPTVTVPAGGASSSDPTLVMSAPPVPPSPPSLPPAERPRAMWPWAAAVLAVALLAIFLVGRLTGEPGLAGGGTSTTTTTPTTTTSTLAPTSTSTAASTTVDAIADTRDRLAAILAETPRSDVNPRDAERILDRIDQAIAAASGGDDKETEKKLRDAAKEIDDKLEGERRDNALAALLDLASLLGVDLTTEDDDD